jgi:hypothetical protein
MEFKLDHVRANNTFKKNSHSNHCFPDSLLNTSGGSEHTKWKLSPNSWQANTPTASVVNITFKRPWGS